jgi:hypothetical protein
MALTFFFYLSFFIIKKNYFITFSPLPSPLFFFALQQQQKYLLLLLLFVNGAPLSLSLTNQDIFFVTIGGYFPFFSNEYSWKFHFIVDGLVEPFSSVFLCMSIPEDRRLSSD